MSSSWSYGFSADRSGIRSRTWSQPTGFVSLGSATSASSTQSSGFALPLASNDLGGNAKSSASMPAALTFESSMTW